VRVYRWWLLWGLGVVALIVMTVLPARARAGVLTSDDQVQLLYTNRFEFDRRGIPFIRVMVAEGRRRAELSCPSAMVVLPNGRSGASIRGGRRWEVSVLRGKAARIRYWTVMETRVGMDPVWTAARVKRYQADGLKVRVFQVGSVFAVSGTMVDNRKTLVAVQPKRSYRSAQRTSSRLARKYGVRTALHAELVSRSHGWIVARDRDTGVVIRNEGMMWFSPVGPGTITVHHIEYAKGYAWHGFADRRYWGMVYAAVDRNGFLAVVNAVPADRLLAGLVPAEMYASAPMAALRAQAVAARGQLLVKIGMRHLADPYLMCASQHCQVYAGAGKEQARSTRAIRDTRGLVLVDEHGHLADTVFHAVCGGHTESNSNVWRTVPRRHLEGVSDVIPVRGRSTGWASHLVATDLRTWVLHPPRTYCQEALGKRRAGLFRWRVRKSFKSLSRTLGRRLAVGRVTGLSVLHRGRSGRALAILVKGTTGRAKVSGELKIRQLLGNLKSTMFIVAPYNDASGRPAGLLFIGGGWGHGVGMCQMGAIGRAMHGIAFRQILGHYYPHTKLIRLY